MSVVALLTVMAMPVATIHDLLGSPAKGWMIGASHGG
jgi:hypothetical protein